MGRTALIDNVADGAGGVSEMTGALMTGAEGLSSRSMPFRALFIFASRFFFALLDFSKGSKGKSLTCMQVNGFRGTTCLRLKMVPIIVEYS